MRCSTALVPHRSRFMLMSIKMQSTGTSTECQNAQMKRKETKRKINFEFKTKALVTQKRCGFMTIIEQSNCEKIALTKCRSIVI